MNPQEMNTHDLLPFVQEHMRRHLQNGNLSDPGAFRCDSLDTELRGWAWGIWNGMRRKEKERRDHGITL